MSRTRRFDPTQRSATTSLMPAQNQPPLQNRPSAHTTVTSTHPLLHCCETWQVLAARNQLLQNRPQQAETWHAIEQLDRELLQPLESRYGIVTLTYGFAGRELTKAVEKRATEGGWLPNITPAFDQHAGHELNTRGNRICKRDGFAVDMRVPGHSSLDVASWVSENLPFDRMYLYDDERPFHLSWAPKPVAMVVRMVETESGHLIPRVIRR